jgi:hypothetical protein
MNLEIAVIWMFLGVFLATALIALASLPGWIRLEDYYKKKLFVVLILEVVASIVGFAGKALIDVRNPPPDLAVLLTSRAWGWDWQNAETAWRSRFQFKAAADNKMTLVGDTYLVDRGGDNPPVIIKWESTQAFTVPKGAQSVEFVVRRTWTQAAADANPAMRWEVGKSTEMRIAIQTDLALRGAARDATSAKPWGMMMTEAFPR